MNEIRTTFAKVMPSEDQPMGAKPVSTASTSRRRQTCIQSFFDKSSSKRQTVSFPDCSIVPRKRKADFPMTPPTPISPQTPQTPPDNTGLAISSSTPPTDYSVPEELSSVVVKRAVVIPALPVADVSVCSGSSTRSASSSFSSPTNKPSRPLRQTYLDLGQSNFAKRTICNTCGMLSVHGLAEDTKEHAKICQDYLKGVPFGVCQSRIVARNTLGFIVEVRPSDSASLRNKVKRVRTIVDLDLGFSPSDESRAQRTAYLYILNHRVVGMATAEIIDSAHLLDSTSLSRSTEYHKALAGIHQLWVHASVRKQGIATRLIDAVRANLVFGLFVPAELVAFSSPTEAGASFARRYSRANHVEGRQVLVYDCY